MFAGLLLFCASAWAKKPQTITFMSAPPSSAVAGGSFVVSATSSSGLPVLLHLMSRSNTPACSWIEPPTEVGLEPSLPRSEPEPRSPSATVYLVSTGTCTVEASGEGNTEYEEPPRVSQTIKVAPNSSEQITFASSPTNAGVGGSYTPFVRSSPSVAVSFSISTGYVCAIQLSTVDGEYRSTIVFLHAGVCTIEVREFGLDSEPPEAQQSFTVTGVPEPLKVEPGPVAPTVEPGRVAPTVEPGPVAPKVEPGPAHTGEGSIALPLPGSGSGEVEKTPSKVEKASTEQKKTSAKGGISAKVRDRLLKEATDLATTFHDSHPFDIQAVRTTAREAPQSGVLLHQVLHLHDSTAVYLVAMRGHFGVRCKERGGQSCRHGSVVEFDVVATTFERTPVGSFPGRYPNLKEFGTPVHLGPMKADKAPS